MLSGALLYALVAAVYAATTDGVLRDDAYIFFQYARNWAETGCLAFNPAEPSFGITSILWTTLLAAGLLIIPDPVFLAKLLGVVLGSLGCVLWAKWVFDRLERTFSVSAVVMAALVPAVGAGRMVVGMETSLACFLSGSLLGRKIFPIICYVA